jgi:hypothetical protein
MTTHMSEGVEISMSVPLDSDGFLRRECPTCEREFKWKPAQDEEEAVPAPEGGYFCPYCVVQAPPDSWWTKDQIEAAQATAFEQVLKPELDKLGDSAGRSGFLEIEVSVPDPEPPQALEEADDMRSVVFACHPAEPVKVLDEWQRNVHCLICGQGATRGTDET